MAYSQHTELAETLRSQIAGWGSLPADVTVSRAYQFESYIGGLSAAAPACIVCLPFAASNTQRETRGGYDSTDQVCHVVYLRKLDDYTDLTEADAADLEAETLRSFLQSLNRVAGAARSFSRVSTVMVTPVAAEILRQHEVFVSVMQCTYRTFAEGS